jgi:monofunctional biosynthetic peptidoglycan transglycosylase
MRLVLRSLLLLVFGFFLWLWWVWPPPLWYRWMWPKVTSFMALRKHEAARDNKPYTLEYVPVPAKQIAPVLKDAAMAGEDQRFYQHGGIDFVEFRKALGYRPDSFSWASARDRGELFDALRNARNRKVRGASTISQQLAKNLYLSPSRNPLRKLKEAFTAWRLEYWLGKERILELYLNVVEFGPGVWGAEAASRRYFRKSAAKLTMDEAAALAGTLPFPLRSNPGYRPGRMRWRQNMILRWLRGEKIEIPPAPEIPAVDTVPVVPDSLVKPDTIPPDTIPLKPDTIPARGVRR